MWPQTIRKYNGTFLDGNTVGNSPINSFDGITTNCVEGGGSGGNQPPENSYHFYHVLLAR